MRTGSAPEISSSELRGDQVIQLTVPARESFLRTVRLVVADACARAGFVIDATEDVRLAVTELCRAILSPAAATMTLRCAFSPNAIEVTGVADGSCTRAGELDPIAQLVLDCMSIRYRVETSSRGSSFVFEKREESE